MRAEENYVAVALVGAAHGVRGGLRLKYYGLDAQRLRSYDCLYDKTGQSYFLEDLRATEKGLIVWFKDIGTRTAAQSLTGTELYVTREQLDPADLEEDEFYHMDLLHLKVQAPGQEEIGEVCGVFNFGAGDLLEVGLAKGGRSYFLPFTKALVPRIDFASKRLYISEEALAFLK